LYHEGNAGQIKKLGKERKVKTRSLKTEGCGTPAKSPFGSFKSRKAIMNRLFSLILAN
jgi:hypothetical protein